MENPAEDVDQYGDLLPREETLVRLYELVASLNARTVPCPVWFGLHAGEDDYEPHGFRFGCCRDAARSDNATDRPAAE